MKYIRLNTGTLVVVDDEDFEWLNQWKWFESKAGYALRKPWLRGQGKSGPNIFMHRLIAGTPKGMHTDHINGCQIDNRRSNLRIATPSQNQANRKRPNRNSASGCKGVIRAKQWDGWMARIKVNRKGYHLGCFKTKEEAKQAYDAAAKLHFGEFSA